MSDQRNLLQESLATIQRLQARLAASEARTREPIAIIGAGCRYPGEVENVDDLWRVVRDGVDAVSEVPADRWDVNAYYDPDPAAPNKMVSRRAGFVGQVDRFDPQFFGISPREATTMDPQQRLLLETAYEALESAGLAVDQLAGSATGVFVGITTGDYARMLQAGGPDGSDVYSATGGAMNAAAGRISFTFGFQGPCMALDTACSSSLVATHLACQSLRTGESDLALAGGVNLILSPDAMVLYSRWGMLAPDGACKTFDADADGFGRAEGCAVIALKRLSDALAAGDPILAVIRGSAVNSDGRSSGLTVPNGPAQEAVLRKALTNAGLKAADIDYVEAMGTGTPIGDPIEVEALGAVLGAGRPAGSPLRIGSVKTNLGHTEAASGLAGLLKTVMALRHETLPPNLHFSTPNPRIDWERLPIEVQVSSTAWPRGDRARRAGVSSFGFSGTNAHVILEEAPVRDQAPETRPGAVLLPLSARNERALRDLAGRYARAVETPGIDLHALAAAAGAGRSHMTRRAAVTGESAGELAATLRALAAGNMPPDAALGATRGGERPKIAFLFAGQGAQYAGMGRTLYEREPVFRAVLDRAQAVLANRLERPLTEVMFGRDDRTISLTAYTQPALFALEYALAEQWRAWGVAPAMVLGHSVGEYVAACVAGVFDFENGLDLIAARGRAMQALPEGGAMAAVFATADRVAAEVARYADRLSVAALNGPEETVIAGTAEAVDGVLAALAAQGVEGRRLEVSHAFHSPLLEPMLAAFEARAAGLTYALPQIPLVSNLTGRVFAPGERPDAAYWRRHAREPVQFVQGLDVLRQAGVTALVEIGPDPTLIALAGRAAPDAAWAALPSLRRGRDDQRQMLQALAGLYVRGHTVRWDAFAEGEPRRRAPLPTYPFQRQRAWLDATPAPPTAQVAGGITGLSVRSAGCEDLERALEASTSEQEASFRADDPARHREAAAAFVRKEIARVLGFSATSLDENAPLLELGLDSLMAVQLRNAVGARLRIDAPLTRLLGGVTAAQLTAELSQTVAAPASAEVEAEWEEGVLYGRETVGPCPVSEQARSVEALVARVGARGVQLWFEGERLCFRARRGSLDAENKAALSEHRDAVVATLRIAAAAETVIPATAGQQMHWFNRQMEPERTDYNIGIAIRISSPVAVDVLMGALQAVTDRHPALRSTFAWDESGPVQKIPGWKAVAFAQHDVRGIDEDGLRGVVEAAVRAPFDLTEGPLFRTSLHTREDNDHVLTLVAHHIVFDGGSMFKVLAELRALYAEAIGQAPAELPRGSADPAAFTAWHRDLLAGPEGARMEAYWAEAMGDLGSRVVLAGDRPSDAEPIRQAMLGADVSPDLIENVRRAATVHGVTPFVLYLAAYQAVLQRWTGADDVIVGTPAFYGRAHPDFTDAVGDFVNILPLRARVTQQTTLADMVAQGRAAMHGALEAQALPFPRILEIVQPGRVPGRTPLVSAMMTLQRFDELRELAGLFAPVAGAEPFDFAGLKVMPYPLNWLPNPFDLQLQLMQVGDSVHAYWGFDAAVFDLVTIEQFHNDFLNTLLAISTTPEKTVAALDVSRVSPAEAGDALLERLAERDIQCSLDGEKLRVNAPKGALDDAIRADIGANRDALLVALRRRAKPHAATGGIPPLAENRRPELSFAQRRLWFLDQMDPGSVRYNIGGGVRLTGPIDTEILRLALEDIFARHEAFRTKITTEDGVARVEILERSRIPIAISDLSSTPQDERGAIASAACASLLGASLDLGSGIAAGAQIIAFAPDDHVLALSMHHILSDGWSLAIIFRDLRTAYDSRISGAAPNLTPPKIRYVDFAAWEQDRAAAHGFDKSSAYWRRALAGAPPLIDLPSDHPRPPNGSMSGARARAYIDEALIDRLEATARAHGATLFMALVGAWQMLLSRLSGQDDVVIGTTVANRDNVLLEEVVGFLVNNVPVRGDLSGSPSFADLLTRTKLAVLGAFEHADLPFEALVEAVNPERTAAHAPIFQTLLTLFNFPMDSVGPDGSSMDPVEFDLPTARFDLALDLARMLAGPKAGQMSAVYEYAADLFDEATILRWHGAFVRLLEAACAAPERPLAEVPLMPPAEAKAFYARLNDTALEHDRSRPTHALLEAAAQRYADEIAIVAPDGQLTYAEFEARTNQLANLLVSRGVKPGSRVAVCLERGLDLPMALAAAWKAGAAYVPLDPGHPAQRIAYVLEDADVACAVTTSALASIFEGASAPLVQLDVDGAAIAAASTAPTGVHVAPEELAYVIYTSGSTGRPKGVEIEHRNLVAFLEAMKREPGIRAGDTLLAVTTPSFDIAGLELWLPLSVGGRVLIASRQDTLDGKRVVGLLEEHRVAMMQATPATWRLMLESGWEGKAGLTALCGGEAMPLDLARSLAPRVSALWNMYGPTETTIWSTIYRVKGDESVIPIGGPIANTRIYVLDQSGAPSPIGAPGELVITGEGVTRGYRNRPELNAEKFAEVSPLATPERAFKTGDLARWRSDGQLDFLGRGDGQVKIRGFRIELGEIEARLATLPAIRSAVVVAREDAPGEKRLVAYVVPATGATFDETATRAALRETLPDYMAPSVYVRLDRLPLSPNGKVDRKALPAPSASANLAPDAAEALMTPIERDVAALWGEILRLDRVGLHQNFFDLGGHSLLLVKLQVALKASFGQEITIVELFQRTTVAAQAERFASPAPGAADTLERARDKARKAALSRADLRRLA